MSDQDKFWLRSPSGEKINVTEDVFRKVCRFTDTYRRRIQEHGECVVPASKRRTCNCDCMTCRFHRGNGNISLDVQADCSTDGDSIQGKHDRTFWPSYCPLKDGMCHDMNCSRCHHYTDEKQQKKLSNAKRFLDSQIHDEMLIEDAVILDDLCRKLKKYIPNLPDAERVVIEGLLCGKSEHQIAAELGTKQSTVNYQKAKAFAWLRKRLE